MEIKLKSNRNFLIYFSVTFCILYGVLVVYMIYAQLIRSFNIFSEPLWFISSIVIFIFFLILTIILKYYKGKSYIFNESSILVYDKGVFVREIKRNKIKTMRYYPYRLHYLITMYAGALKEGGARKIHIYELDGSYHEIGLLTEKEAIMLQEKLYPNIMEIMYDKRKHRKAV